MATEYAWERLLTPCGPNYESFIEILRGIEPNTPIVDFLIHCDPVSYRCFVAAGSDHVGAGSVGTARQGISVAISQNATIIAVGGQLDDNSNGAVWMFERSGDVWLQNGAKLIGSNGFRSFQGKSVALSADGNTLVEGGIDDENSRGAVWTFQKKGSEWRQQGGKLFSVDAVGGSEQGYSVSLDYSGNVLAVGAPGLRNVGSVFIYERDNCKLEWNLVGNKIIGKNSLRYARLGQDVSLSSDGSLLAVGASSYDDSGTTLVFERKECVYVPIQKITGSGSVKDQHQGRSVSLSANGKTLAIGGPATSSGNGKTWIFKKLN
ncbi:MAG: T9SS C-terminal target domain-containing protein [Harvfovirus sp.]|uniref:T9SS C-terminal target domain-containing protein n=1 Tax=Harvfovirus sp. TaxID=2487768 RepID=A0A3G5A661_9VIRU|nr:MAG: T9SS C-terminal target domain-containing protein [Harvfovirus sp.]